jgi:hypothetical protein
MHADTGGVDHHDVAVVSCGDRFEKPVPDPSLPPPDEAVVTGGRRTVAIRDLSPRRTRSKPPEDAVQNPPVINTGNPARLVGQQRRQDRPFMIAQFVTATRHSRFLPFRNLESRQKPNAK